MRTVSSAAVTLVAAILLLSGCTQGEDDVPKDQLPDGRYPWHTNIIATTFWVGEIFDPEATDGSQELSTYDSRWMESYGGCDGVVVDGVCTTERRTAENDFFPTSMSPRENPFYLDLPFDDVNNDRAFALRGEVVPWAGEEPYASRIGDRRFSLMKNRWVELRNGDAVCFGQVQDAGPAVYDDTRYVFGEDDRRPVNRRFNGAGMDVSPALNGCLGFRDVNGKSDDVHWRFVDEEDVPVGPWLRIVTNSGVQ